MLCRNRLFSFTLRNLVGFGGDEGDEFDAAVDEQVAGVSREGDAGFGIVGGENFGDYLLYGCYG